MRRSWLMPKAAKNLYLEPDVVERGERYSRLHGTTLSRLVSDFLKSLPLEPRHDAFSPAVQRLVGAAVPRGRKKATDDDARHEHLWRKYGKR